jgi:ATP-dependent 26S proteasome regulatory subunit
MAIVPAATSTSNAIVAHGVRLHWAPELADRLFEGMPLTVLGQAPLDPPLGRLLILARSEPGRRGAISLAAVVVPNGSTGALALAPFGLGPLAGALEPPAELLQYFAARRTSEAIYVQDANRRDLFVVGPGVVLNQLVISSGSWPLLAPLFGPRARARPPVDLATVQRELSDFCAVVNATVNSLYHRQRLAPPTVTLTLRPTGLNVDAAVTGFRWLGRSAAEIVARLPKAAPLGPADTPRVSVSRVDSTPDSSFEEVGGLEEAKRELQAICLAIKNPDAYRRWGARPPKGVLLYGPPGTGKTLLARCLARESSARFIHVRAPDITSKWYGEAERRMQATFDRARREAPAVIFFDEIDAIARAREESHEATHRVVSTLLENMDGLEEAGGVIVVAATNRPESVDAALTRPGRFDRLVEVPLPNRSGRSAIFRVHIRKAETNAGRALFEPLDSDWNQLLDATEGFSGAEIEETIRRALEAKVRAGATEGQIILQDVLSQAATVSRPW